MIGKDISIGIKLAIENLDKHISPITDLRGTSDYRLNVFKGVLRKLDICLKQNKKQNSFMEIV